MVEFADFGHWLVTADDSDIGDDQSEPHRLVPFIDLQQLVLVQLPIALPLLLQDGQLAGWVTGDARMRAAYLGELNADVSALPAHAHALLAEEIEDGVLFPPLPHLQIKRAHHLIVLILQDLDLLVLKGNHLALANSPSAPTPHLDESPVFRLRILKEELILILYDFSVLPRHRIPKH
jgi:hypothetical protein